MLFKSSQALIHRFPLIIAEVYIRFKEFILPNFLAKCQMCIFMLLKVLMTGDYHVLHFSIIFL